ncbi:MAG: hypothetical protein FWG29_08650 [Treponema sp.]|nr:hypothetical protein [Treponema sp.]
MGLLSKAAAGTSTSDDFSSLDEPSKGGLLKLIHQKHRKNTEETIPVHSSNQENAIMENLSESYSKFGVFKGVIVEMLKNSAGESTGRLASMISGFGAVQGLSPVRALVLFDSKQDCELIGKHLAKTVPGKNIFSFQANTPQEALLLIQPFL